MNELNTVFQAEIFAITKAATALEALGATNEDVTNIYVDSQAALMALDNRIVNQETVRNCIGVLNRLGLTRQVVLHWIKAHVGHAGNERADLLAKQGTEGGDRTDLPIPVSHFKATVKTAVYEKWDARWKNSGSCRQTKLFFPSVRNEKRSEDMMRLDRLELGKAVQFITGHGYLNYHMNLVHKSLHGEVLCRLCEEEKEDAWHLIAVCPRLTTSRLETFSSFLLDQIPPNWSISQLTSFLNGTLIGDLLVQRGVE